MRGIAFIHRLSFAVTAALFAGTAWAGPPLPPSVAAAQLNYQQTVRQQQLATQLQQNQLQEQLREQQQSRLRSHAGNPAMQSQIDHLGAAQRDLYQAQQRSLIQNYNNQVPAALPASRRAVIAPMVNGRIGGP